MRVGWLTRIWRAILLAVWLGSSAFAQADLIKEFDRWTELAAQIETALDSENTPDFRFRGLRARAVEFRSEFETIKGLNTTRIATLREQIAALGPAPETNDEAADVSATRKRLNDQLTELLVPRQRAEAEFVRADALVSQIDQTLRDRQTQELLNKSPSPLNPAYWPPAIGDLVTAADQLWQEAPESGATIGNEEIPREPLVVTVMLAVLGLVLIIRGRHWSRMIASSLQRFGARGFDVWRFMVSLLRIILPAAGLLLLSLAAISSQLFGPKVDDILLLVAFLGAMMLGVRWVTDRVFSRDDDEALILLLPKERGELRFHVGIITALIVVSAIIDQVLGTSDPAPASKPVLMFPITVAVSISLYRIGVLLRGYTEPQRQETEGEEGQRTPTLTRATRGFGLAAIALAIVAPLLAAAGYYRAADALLPPFIMTMALLGLVMALQRFAADVYGAITGQGAQAREALLPVVFGLVLLVLAGPLLALAWGARITDLTEAWAAFLRGFSFGDTRISPSDFVTFAVIFALGYAVTRLLQSALRSNVLPKTKLDIGGQNAIISGLGYVGIFLAALAAITGAGIDLSSLAIVAGALSVGIGFGLQNIVSNFVSGIILLIERPISEGDWIEVGGQMGYVRDISVRSTRIETFDRTDVIVPNADLVSGTVTNYTRGNTVGRVIIPVGVAYGSDTREVARILQEIAESQPMVLANPPPSVVFMGIGASTYDFTIRAILRDVNWILSVTNDINHEIVARFAEADIEMAFPQLDVWMRSPVQSSAPPQDMPVLTRNDTPESSQT